MPRPPRQDPSVVRALILEAARRDILAGGLEALSLRSVAREIGYSSASVYQHFANRDAVLLALRQEATARLRAALAAAPSATPDEHPLVAMGLAYVRTCREHPGDLELAGLLRSRVSLGEEIPTLSPYRLVVEELEACAARGELDIADRETTETMAYGVWALVEGIVELHRTHLRDFDADFERADRFVLRALLSGYGVRAEGWEQ